MTAPEFRTDPWPHPESIRLRSDGDRAALDVTCFGKTNTVWMNARQLRTLATTAGEMAADMLADACGEATR